MFKITCDGTTIYDPRIADLAVLSGKISLELNKAGSFVFQLPPEHTYYDLPQKMASKIIVYWDDAAIFYGRCTDEETDFWNRKTVTCEGELAYLNDTIQRPGEYHDITPREYLETLISSHNAEVDEDRQFTVGIVTVTDSNDSIYRYTNYNSTMEEIKADLVDDLGGYLKVRNEDGYRYLDYVELEDYGDTSSQVIEFGENLLDFTRNVDMSDIATAIIPLGAKLDESSYTSIDERLTIADVNDGSDCIQSDEAVETYGFICKTVTWDSVTTAEYLLSKAKAHLEDYQFENMVIEASALDLHYTDDDAMRLNLGDKVRIKSTPHGMDRYFFISKMTVDLLSPSSNTITLGIDDSTAATLTAAASSISTTVKANANIQSTFLANAIAQATALITASTHGYVMLNDTDGDGEPDELVIMDTDDVETATNVWRWNLNGLGYSSTGYNGTYGTAITMDGTIVGTYIAAGTIGAEQLSVEYTESVETEISNAVLESKDYTDEQLANYYTQSEVSQLFSVNNATLLSEISTIYVTSATYTSGLSETLGTAEAYADTIVSSLETALKEYADAAADSAESDANDYTDTKLLSYSTTSEVTTLIEQTQESILLSVSGTYVTTATYEAGLESAISTSESYADSVAATTLSSAQEYTDTLLTSYSTTTEVESKIEALSDSITLSISSLTESIAEVSADLSALVVGATNLLLGTSSDWEEASVPQYYTVVYERTISDLDLEAGDTLMFSGWIQVPEDNVKTVRARLEFYTSSSDRTSTYSDVYVAPGETAYFSFGTELAESLLAYTTVRACITSATTSDTSTETIYYKKFQLEEGTTASDWSPAPEDAIDYVDTLLLSYYTSEELDTLIEQTQESILLEVSSTYVTAVTYSSGLSSTLTSAQEYADSVADSAEADAIAAAQESLTSALASYYTKTETDSLISVSQSEILLEVSGSYVLSATYEAGIASTLSSAEEYADAAQAAAQEYADTVATAAQTAAEEAAASALTSALTSYYTSSETDSLISVSETSILASVAASYVTTATFEALTVGATNLLLDSRDFSDWSISNSSIVSIELDDDDFGVVTFADEDALAWNAIRSPLILLSKVDGQEVTVSFWCRAADADSYAASSGYFMAELDLHTTYSYTRTLYKSIGTVKAAAITDEWVRYSFTVTVSEDLFSSGSGTYSEAVYLDLRFYNYSLYAAQVKKPKMEIGNIATDWSPAPEDAEDYVDTVLTAYSTTEETQTLISASQDAILLSVSGTYVTTATYTSGLSSTLTSAQEYADSAASTAESNAESYTDAVITSYSTTEEVESLISASTEAITLSISSTYATIETVTTLSGDLEAETERATAAEEALSASITATESSILLEVSSTYVTTTTYTSGLSDTLSSAESYTDTALGSYSTTEEMTSAISVSASSILSTVSSTYATASSVSTLSSTLTQTASTLEASIEDTQSNARTYFAADSTSISCSSGTVTFKSNTFAVSSTYFTLTAAGKITATEVNVSGAFEADGDDYWIKIDDGEITGGTDGSSTVNGYFVVDDEYGDTGLYGTSIGGRGMIALRTPKLLVTAYSDPGNGSEADWYTGNTQTVYAVTSTSSASSNIEKSQSIYTSYSTSSATYVSSVTTSTQTVVTAVGYTYHTLITSYSTFSSYIVSNVSTTTSSGYVTAISQTRTYYTNIIYSPTTTICYHLSGSSAATTTSLSYVKSASTSTLTYISSLTSSTLYYLGSSYNNYTQITTLNFIKGLLCSSYG